MFCILGILLLGAGLVEGKVGVTCKDPTGCGSGECCMRQLQLKGKRGETTGTCTLMGTDRSNTQCYVENRFQSNGVYGNRCPCASGLTCVPSGMQEVPYGMTGTCQRSHKQAAPTSCQTGADCKPSQCCMSRVRPLGKRMLAGGVCKDMLKTGQHCLSRYGSGKPKGMVFSCPCLSALKCVEDGTYDMPLGKMGVCT